jgi:pyruvate dehydrogenase E1 component alpha subunit
MKNCLLHLGLWSEEQESALEAELEAEFLAAVEEADQAPEPRPWEIVEQVYAEMQPDQQAAWNYLRGEG